MNLYALKSRWKLWLMLMTLAVVAASLLYANRLARDMAEQERQRMLMVGEFMRLPGIIPPEVTDFDFTVVSRMTEMNKTIPMILTDAQGHVVSAVNYGDKDAMVDTAFFRQELKTLKGLNQPIEIEDPYTGKQLIYYRNSTTYTQLTWFPFVQLFLVGLLVIVGYLAFSTARRSEQNLVWVGMAKETAHQLGTPLSSLIALVEMLKAEESDSPVVEMTIPEFEKDIEHLKVVAERFSKIGATPELKPTDLHAVLQKNLAYIRPRASRKVSFDFPAEGATPIMLNMNTLLFDWVIENLLKNALDAMGPEGKISAHITEDKRYVYLDLSDTGKGIPKSKFKTIFRPGYSTKTRGWGLGLSLTKRIVEEYHGGKISVLSSVINEGTTFRIQLRKLK